MASRIGPLAGAAGLALTLLIASGGFGSAQDAANTTGPSPPSAPAPVAPDDLAPPPPDEPAPAPEEAAPSPPAHAAAATNTTAPAPPPPPPEPLKRARYTTAILQALDKVTAETLRFEATVNEPVRYKDLVLTVRACETSAPDEDFKQTAAHIEVQDQPDVLPGRAPQVAHQVFRGWMFADSPGLNPFKHPIYDVWVIACKTPAPAPPTPPAASTGASL